MRRMGMRALLATMAIAALLAFGMMAAGCQGNSGGDQAAPAEQADAQAGHEAAADQAEAATYSFKTCVLERSADDAAEPVFSYLQLSSSADNALVDELNGGMKQNAEAAYDLKMNDEIYTDPTEEQTDQQFYESYTFGVSYFEGPVICIVHGEYSIFPQAAHGTPTTTVLLYDLDAQTDVTAASLVGLENDELGKLAWAALDRYLAANGDIYGSAAEAFPDAAADEVVPEDSVVYCMTKDGVVAIFQPYAVGSYAMGMPHLLVCGPDGAAVESDEEAEIEFLPGDGEEDVA